MDRITVEIIREQLIAAAKASFLALGRSGQSPIMSVDQNRKSEREIS